MRNSFIQEAIDEGMELGRLQGFQRGREKGLDEGRQEGLGPLIHLFERLLGRPLRENERKRIALRLTKQGPEKLASVVLDLSPEALARWLKPRKPKKSTAAPNANADGMAQSAKPV